MFKKVTDIAKAATNVQCKDDDDSNLILQQHHRNLLDECRRSFHSCGASDERLKVCVKYRDNVLAEHATVRILAAKIERVMVEECEEYRRRKQCGWFQETENGEAASWKIFIDVAHKGRIDKCLIPLRSVRKHWGEEIVQHYGWVNRGERTCKALCSVARKNSWKEFIIKQNQVELRRTQIKRRRKLRRS